MVVSLKESCIRRLVEVGNCSYRLIRPVLFACQPDQLAHIEDCSPVRSRTWIIRLLRSSSHIMLESDEIWSLFLTRDFPNEVLLPPDTIRSPSSSDPSHPALDEEGGLGEVELPPHRVHYFKIRQAKEEALASASARLREKVQASRSDQHKRKAIFTGLTDYGLGSKKKKLNGSSKSWGSYTPAGKTLAEKARQHVKKSAAVYANAVRAKAALIITPNSAPQYLSRTPVPARPTSTPIFSIRKPLGRTSSPSCVLRASAAQPQVKVVQVPTVVATSSTNNTQQPAIKPTPFPQPKPPPQPQTGPLTTPLLRRPLSRTPSLPVIPPSSSNKTSTLFMPKKLRPPPPQPSRSLIHRASSSSQHK
ncbi:hypothetical protein VP01_843g1 [Puccinia sorghi]|uniref:Elongin-A n=1 Tax=Puccinia sorghi TaxID=27349 RepID=A0A0L6UA02_9BASI|nr:hypothetical protein VP01_843g1 [Puccinia sorghi]